MWKSQSISHFYRVVLSFSALSFSVFVTKYPWVFLFYNWPKVLSYMGWRNSSTHSTIAIRSLSCLISWSAICVENGTNRLKASCYIWFDHVVVATILLQDITEFNNGTCDFNALLDSGFTASVSHNCHVCVTETTFDVRRQPFWFNWFWILSLKVKNEEICI